PASGPRCGRCRGWRGRTRPRAARGASARCRGRRAPRGSCRRDGRGARRPCRTRCAARRKFVPRTRWCTPRGVGRNVISRWPAAVGRAKRRGNDVVPVRRHPWWAQTAGSSPNSSPPRRSRRADDPTSPRQPGQFKRWAFPGRCAGEPGAAAAPARHGLVARSTELPVNRVTFCAMADGTTHRGTGEVADSSWRSRLKQVGPGVMAAATGVGAGDLVATLVAGARYGYLLFWAVVLGTVFKLVLGEAVGRWHLAARRTMLSGWRTLGMWATTYFGAYIVIWGFVYGATAMSASALPLNALFPVLPVSGWAVVCGLLGLVLVWFGRYAVLEKIMTVLGGVMFVTVVGTAVLVGPNLLELGNGLVPRLPEGSVAYVLGLMGGVGGTITMASYGYWTFAKGWRSPRWLPFMRTDNAVGYITTGIFVV